MESGGHCLVRFRRSWPVSMRGSRSTWHHLMMVVFASPDKWDTQGMWHVNLCGGRVTRCASNSDVQGLFPTKVWTECPIQMFDKVSNRSVWQTSPQRVSYKSVLQGCIVGVSHEHVVSKEYLTKQSLPSRGDLPDATRLSRKSVSQRSVPQRSVPQRCPALSHKSGLEEFPTASLQERLVGFLLKGVFTRVS